MTRRKGADLDRQAALGRWIVAEVARSLDLPLSQAMACNHWRAVYARGLMVERMCRAGLRHKVIQDAMGVTSTHRMRDRFLELQADILSQQRAWPDEARRPDQNDQATE